MVTHLNDNTFNYEVLNSSLPVVVDFGATWCGPCKIVDAYMEDIAVEFQNRAKIFKFLVDDNPVIPSQYGIRTNPTILFFKKGELVNQFIGSVTKSKVIERLNEIL